VSENGTGWSGDGESQFSQGERGEEVNRGANRHKSRRRSRQKYRVMAKGDSRDLLKFMKGGHT